VAGGGLTFAFSHETGLVGQIGIVNWSDRDSTTIWQGALDLSSFDALVLDMGLVTQPVRMTLFLREKNTATSHEESFIVDQFGLHVFDLLEFDHLDLSQLDILSLRLNPHTTVNNDGLATINGVFLFEDEVIFSDDFDLTE
jgi:hypothetical protein